LALIEIEGCGHELVDRIQQLVPSFVGGDDFVWVCSPSEGLGAIVGFVAEAVDGSLEFANRSEDTAFEAPYDRQRPI
jgi:hypothetical protein